MIAVTGCFRCERWLLPDSSGLSLGLIVDTGDAFRASRTFTREGLPSLPFCQRSKENQRQTSRLFVPKLHSLLFRIAALSYQISAADDSILCYHSFLDNDEIIRVSMLGDYDSSRLHLVEWILSHLRVLDYLYHPQWHRWRTTRSSWIQQHDKSEISIHGLEKKQLMPVFRLMLEPLHSKKYRHWTRWHCSW